MYERCFIEDGIMQQVAKWMMSARFHQSCNNNSSKDDPRYNSYLDKMHTRGTKRGVNETLEGPLQRL